MKVYWRAIHASGALASYSMQWEWKLSFFNKKFQILNNVLWLGTEIIMEEDLLGGDSCENLQSYVYILELKIEMFQQYMKDMA